MSYRKNLLPLLFLIVFSGCLAQKPNNNDLFISDFNWKLQIPDFLVSENMDEWLKVQEAGKKAIGETYHVTLKNALTTIFVFKTKDQSFFEATSEKYNKEKLGDYAATCEKMNDVVYHTLATQAPTAKVDTIKTVETIDNIPFQTLTTKITYQNGNTRNAVIFRSLFDETELTISVMFSNQETGKAIIDSFKKSSFHFSR